MKSNGSGQLLHSRSIFYHLLLFLIIGISLLRKLYDPDIWFHMVVGREVMRRMDVPGEEFYILPRMGEPGEFYEWGFGVVYYWVEHFAGYTGMAVVNAAFGCAILFFLYRAAHGTEKQQWWQPLPVMALALLAIELRLNFRPETLFYLFVAIEIYLLEKYLVQRKAAWLLPLPILSWLLSLCHPSVIFLLGVFGVYALHAFIDSTTKARTAAVLGATALLMAGASILNPHGTHQLLMPFRMLAEGEFFGSIDEFMPIMDTAYVRHFIMIVLAGLLAILFAPKRRIVDILLLLAFGFLAFRYARNITLLAIVAYVPISNTFNSWIKRWVAKNGKSKMAAAFFSVTAGFAGIAQASTNPTWGIGLGNEYIPYTNAGLLKRAAVQGNILNFFHLGSYLAWELDRPVFVDGRNFGINKAVMLHDGIFNAELGWREVVKSYNIQAIVTPATLTVTGEIIPLVAVLEQSNEWVVVGQERAGLLFVRGGGQEAIPSLPRETIWRQAIEELDGTIQSYPGSREAYRSLSTAYGNIGDTVKQREYYEKYQSLH